jgi:hypothetical protein
MRWEEKRTSGLFVWRWKASAWWRVDRDTGRAVRGGGRARRSGAFWLASDVTFSPKLESVFETSSCTPWSADTARERNAPCEADRNCVVWTSRTLRPEGRSWPNDRVTAVNTSWTRKQVCGVVDLFIDLYGLSPTGLAHSHLLVASTAQALPICNSSDLYLGVTSNGWYRRRDFVGTFFFFGVSQCLLGNCKVIYFKLMQVQWAYNNCKSNNVTAGWCSNERIK